VNEEWANDKTRTPWTACWPPPRRLDPRRGKLRGELEATLARCRNRAGRRQRRAVAGDLVDVETMYAAKQLVAAWVRPA
jgi:hypothetical protein